jgi:hypothetical protein
MTDVFISFVQGDKVVATAVKRIVEHDLRPQVSVFMTADQSQLLAGDDWLQRIRQEITKASIVILMLSKRSIATPWVNFEAGAAWIMGKRVIPVCFGNQLKASLPHPYSQWQAVQLPQDEHYLVSTVAGALGIVRPTGRMGKSELPGAGNQIRQSLLAKADEYLRDLNLALERWKDEG